jgi:predicted dehydrogenase
MIRIAIVGTGNIANAHVSGYLQFPERCEIVALVDIVPEKAQRMKERYQLNADVYDDHLKILGRTDIDLVDVCTPPYVHASISINSLKSGKNVVCEKPMAASLEECDAMLRARDESGKKLSIIAQNRFREPIRNLKALLDSGIAGRVRHATINSFWYRAHCYYDLWWRGTWEKEGGGCTLNHAVHHIDMLGWMMGTPEKVTSVLANTGHDNAEVEDLSVSVMEYPGALATVTASVVHHGEEQELIFQCEKAKIAAPYSVFASLPQPNGFPLKEADPAFREKADAFIAGLPPIPWELHTGQLENVLTALETGGDVAITGEDGRRTIELITAIYKSGAERKTAALPETYYLAQLESCPDILDAKQVIELTGYGTTAVHRWLSSGKLKSFLCGNKRRIPKKFLLAFLLSKTYSEIPHKCN